VVTAAAGFPFTLNDWNSNQKRYDELVITQEAQVVPIFLLRIDNSNMAHLATMLTDDSKNEPPAIIELAEEPDRHKRKSSESSGSSVDSGEENDSGIEMKNVSSEGNKEKPPRTDEVISVHNLLQRKEAVD